jgi:predicted nicotinamide N-methyase
VKSEVVTVELGDRLCFELERPLDPAALLDEERFETGDEFLPYWAESWASGEALARHVAALDLTGARVLELGCGLGLPSLVAASRGADVVATDWAPEATDLLARNAVRNGLTLRAEALDWRDVEAFMARAPFDLVLAADVAYEARDVEPVAHLVVALDAEALVADPGRRHADRLLELLRNGGLTVDALAAPELVRGAIHRVSRRDGSSGADGKPVDEPA